MHSNDIAKNFYNQGRANKWLSARQTAWIYGQACREAGKKLATHGTSTANGSFSLESGETIGWEISVSPINGAALFRTHSVTAIHEQAMSERESQLKNGKQLCQRIKEIPAMADLYPPDVIARMFKVSPGQVQVWLSTTP